MKLTDELLNKYIDGELTNEELTELNNLIETDPEAVKKFRAHKFVDQTLHKINIEKAPSNFTGKLISLLASEQKTEKNYFFRFVISAFVLILSASLIIISIDVSQSEATTKISLGYWETLKTFLTQNLNSINGIFSNNVLLVIGGFLTFILAVTAFFIFESHKDFKKKIDGIVP